MLLSAWGNCIDIFSVMAAVNQPCEATFKKQFKIKINTLPL